MVLGGTTDGTGEIAASGCGSGRARKEALRELLGENARDCSLPLGMEGGGCHNKRACNNSEISSARQKFIAEPL